MIEQRRIIRGDSWGLCLQQVLARAATDTASWMQRETQLLKSDANSLVGLLSLQDQCCYLKLYRYKSHVQKMLFRMGRGRAVRNFDIACKLATNGVPVPRPLACLQVPEGLLLLTEAIAGGSDLADLWQQQPAGAEAGKLLQGAGAAIARLHRAGYAHGDCKWNNLLCARDQFYLVDLDGAHKASAGSARQARDVARFTLNAEELAIGLPRYEMFLASYLQGVDEPRTDVIAGMLPILHTLRARHLTKYGERGQPLF